MRDPAASDFERQFLAWLHIHLGIEPTERAGTNAFWWTFPYKGSTVSFVIVGQVMNSGTAPESGTNWLLRIEENEGAGFIALVEPYFMSGSGVRRQMGRGRFRVQFKSGNQLRRFEDQREGTGLPAARPAAPARPAAGADEPTQLSDEVQTLMSSQFSLLVARHRAANLKPCAAFMNSEGVILGESLDGVDPPHEPDAAINRMSFRLREGLQDGRVIAGAVFFHAVRDDGQWISVDAHRDGSHAIVGYFQHRSGESVQLVWPYERSDDPVAAPDGWKFEDLRLWQAAGLPVLVRAALNFRTPALGGGAVRRCAIEPTGHAALVVMDDGSATLMNVQTHEHSEVLVPPDVKGSAHALDAQRCRMLQGEADGQLIMHHFPSGKSVPLHRAASGPIVSCALSGDGASAFAGTFGGDLLRCDLEWFTTRTLRMHDGQPVSACACSPDGARLITVSTNGRVALWRVERGMPITVHERESSLGNARFAAVSANGRYAALAGGQLFVVWDFELNAPGALTDAGAIIDGCAISPNGQFLLLLLRTGVVRLWDEFRGATRDDLSTSDPATTAVFAPDGGSVLIGHASGAVAYLRWLAV